MMAQLCNSLPQPSLTLLCACKSCIKGGHLLDELFQQHRLWRGHGFNGGLLIWHRSIGGGTVHKFGGQFRKRGKSCTIDSWYGSVHGTNMKVCCCIINRCRTIVITRFRIAPFVRRRPRNRQRHRCTYVCINTKDNCITDALSRDNIVTF